jgi:hypothetical protein
MVPACFTLYALSLILITTHALVCSDDDVRFMFAPCVGDKTEAIAYYARDCGAGSVPLPPPRPAPCSLSCPSGTFYSPKSINCSKCGRGEFSNSGGKIINTFETFPEGFATYCSPAPCAVWSVTPGFESIDSGNQSLGPRSSVYYGSIDDSVEATLSVIVNIINPSGGKLIFQYRVESEKQFDGLVLTINGTAVKNADATVGSDSFFATGLHHQWRQASLGLSFGRAEIRFVYSKDANQISESGKYAGLDRAYLKDFTFEGVQMFAPACSKCAAGEYTDLEGQSDCSVCPRNKYSGVAAPGCSPCDPDTQWSPPGSAACMPKKPCIKDDYVAVYKPCGRNAKRQRDWMLSNSRCIESSRPPSDIVDCAGCMPGFIRAASADGSESSCVPCPDGQFLNKDSGRCEVCQAGTAAVPTLSFTDGFDSFGGAIPETFATMSCTGLCSGCAGSNPNSPAYCTTAIGVFELSSYANDDPNDADGTLVGIRSSASGGSYWTSTLTIPINLLVPGMLDLQYMFAFQDADAGTSVLPRQFTATFTLDEQETLFDPYYVGPTLRGRIAQYISQAGQHKAVITVSQFGRIDSVSAVSLVLLKLSITGDSRGAAAKCQTCSSGNYCPGNTSTFLPCPVAQMQPQTGQTGCVNCSSGTVSKEEGSTWCRWCNFGTVASPTHDLCINSCNVTFGGNNYDFTALRNVVFGPLYPPGARTDLTPSAADARDVHRFFVSPCSFVNTNKSDDKCSLLFGNTVEDAYACQRLNANRSYSIGDDVMYTTTQGGQLQMRITGGNPCSDGTERSTNITFVCDPDTTPGVMQYMGESPKCHYNFLFSSAYGCPRCTPDSFSKVTSDCTADSVITVAYFRKDFAKSCIGGYVPPAPVNFSCSRCVLSDFKKVWSACRGGQQTQSWTKVSTACLDDGKLLFPPIEASRACSTIDAEIGFNGFTLSIALVVALAAMLFFGLYVMYTRHRKLQIEYHRLSNNANEMADVQEDDDDGALDAHNE